MYCKKCGAEIPDHALVCGKCGTPVRPYDSAGQRLREEEEYRKNHPEREARTPEREEGNGEGCARASLVLGILSVLSLLFPYVTIPLSLVAIVLGVLGLGSRYRRRAIVGIVLGVVMLLTGAVLMICVTALAPYSEELSNIFYSYMEQTQ